MLLRNLMELLLLLRALYASLSYSPFVSNPQKKVFVYRKVTTTTESTPVSYLRIGATISHCTIGKNLDILPTNNRKLSFRIGTGYVGLERKNMKWSRCLSKNNVWTYEKSYSNCHLFDTSVAFSEILDLQDEEIFLIVCNSLKNDYIEEIFIEEYPRIQVLGLYSNIQRNFSTLPNISVPHGVKITCISNFHYLTNIIWNKTKINSQPNFAKGQFLIIDLNLKEASIAIEKEENEYQCILSYIINAQARAITAIFKFFIQKMFDIQIVNALNKPSFQFDTGETIRCKDFTNYSKKGYIWYNPIMIGLSKANSDNYTEPPSEVITIKKLENKTLYNASCFLKGFASIKYVIKNISINIITNAITEFTTDNVLNIMDNFTNMKCIDSSENIYLFSVLTDILPLSFALKNKKFIGVTDNKSVSLPKNFSANEKYYVACTGANYTKTPVILDISKSNLINIISIFPSFLKNPLNQMKGYIYECSSTVLDYTALWKCPKCTLSQYQKIVKNNKTSQYLHIIATHDITITYHCAAFYGKNLVTEKLLQLNLYADVTPMIFQPKNFYSIGDPVICTANKISSITYEEKVVPLPSRIIATSETTSVIKNTDDTFEYENISLWSPIIPLNLDYKNYMRFTACCLEYVSKDVMQCGTKRDIDVVVNYTFKYNHDISTTFVYPGNVIKCCIIRLYSTRPLEPEGDLNRDCMAAIVVFYANKNTSANIDNPGILMYEGIQVIVPDTFMGEDIIKVATFVKCYSDNFLRKEDDLKKSAMKLKIKSCNSSPPPLLMFPKDQSLFLVNNTITCIPDSKECGDDFLLDFTITRGGILIEIIKRTISIILSDKYLGTNIRVICNSGTSAAYKDISVERVPFTIIITGLLNLMLINSVITCASDGFPKPNIVWNQINGSSLLKVNDNTILIRNWDRSGPYEMICTAFNKHGETSKKIQFKIFNVNMMDTYSSKEFYIIIYSQLFLFCIFAVLIVYFLFKDYIPQDVRMLATATMVDYTIRHNN